MNTLGFVSPLDFLTSEILDEPRVITAMIALLFSYHEDQFKQKAQAS